ncbi:2-keto-4-pentenoate hydratase/2-oxohepta-3-ene-1,7-dioic acid hydratase (catechol pathway) [Nonomuraea solani]|uniref:2-keto-4-pentenoate hydratase/2-oxohepta-3-ene-1,7-dioic acid hydratase (Catechol pathway) n=1 Tax=Nonomuraea solani TaxID=1144553 RepID=A0A1H6EUZ2_9ACTN|nr:fumarylacetoacetate hydrolase family protein [Nonomuraea solani]SEH00856.1 2-keto-4-pentenoate hydratase/2-oxohepta-3-ene-1,7-dioic acid hydratase (catechol pathway) [Nonomuraea solani]
MSTNVARTGDGWWTEHDGRLTRITTDATTTADLLADRSPIEKAAGTPDPDGPRLQDVSLLSPVTVPARVVAQMVNYRSHAHDSGFDPRSVLPTFFRKASGSVCGPNDAIRCPDHVGFLDYEIELGLVIGRRIDVGTVVTDDDLTDVVAGIAVTNDVSARDIQLTRTQFYEAKSYPTFTPVGPYLTLLDGDELATLERLRLTLSVNGEIRQDSTVADMIVKPARALTLLARFQALDAGDLLLTGTPGGTALKAPGPILEKIGALLPPAVKWKAFFKRQADNPHYLKDGDVIAATITDPLTGIDLGRQTNIVRGPARRTAL